MACTLATLILSDEKISITSDKISTILTAANVTVAPYWPGLFNKTFASSNIAEIVFNAPLASSGPAPAAAAAGPAVAEAAAEEKKEEKKESEADVGAGGLFGDDDGDGGDY